MLEPKFAAIIESEVIGVWAVDLKYDDCPVLIAKLPGTVIKSLSKGCVTELVLGHAQAELNHLGIALRIHDSPGNALLVPMAVRTQAELDGCKALLAQQTFSVIVHDEFNAPVLRGIGTKTITTETEHAPLSLDNATLPTTAEAMEATIASLCYHIDPAHGLSATAPVELNWFKLSIQFQAPLIISASDHSVFHYDVDDTNEGATQENHVFQQLSLLFKNGVYDSPQIQVGKKVRELIDTLVISDEFTLFFESKALCLNDSSDNLDHEKRISKVLRHCKKAVGQLEGAIKNYRKIHPLTDNENHSIERTPDSTLIGIVIISEFSPSKLWDNILDLIQKKSVENKAYFVVLDLVELMKLIKISNYKGTHLGYLLTRRYRAANKYRTLHISSTDSSLPVG